ncbi:MAG: DPP IV N-terminal domain-containing protein, partial [Phycisphaerales bacterium]|nr:DPP IV N-terminal domain-containing protein [Phycisphaerales bacterium]
DEDGNPKDFELDLVNDFVASASVTRPFAYVIPSNLTDIRRKLQEHGIVVEILREDREMDVTRYAVTARSQAERSFNGHRRVDLKVEGSTVSTAIPAGTFVVRTDQPLGTLAVNLLEPEAEDGYASWDLIGVAEGEAFPVLRLETDEALLLGSARPLDADRTFHRSITFDTVQGRDRPDFEGRAQGGFDWIDESHYRISRGGAAYDVEATTGRMTRVESAKETFGASLETLDWLDDRTRRRLADRAPSASGFVFEFGNDLYFCPPDGTPARRLTSTPEEEELHEVSPDGRFVGFVRDNDLWVVDVRTGTERALTRGGHDTLRRGKASWVYFEEVFGRRWKTWWWSEESRHIAFFETDSSLVDTFTIVDDVPDDQRIEIATFPKPGTDNPRVRLAIADIGTGAVRWADLDGYTPGDMLITKVGWFKDDAWFIVQNRVQSWYEFCTVGAEGGRPKRLFRIESPAWIEPPLGPWVQENGDILLACERSGYRHLYLYSPKGDLIRQVTDGEWEIQQVLGVHDGWAYITTNARSPIASHLDRVRLEDGVVEPLTRHKGSHRISLGESHYIDTWSTFTDPTKVALYRLDGGFVRWIDTNPQFLHEEYDFVTPRHVQIPGATEGVVLEATITYPPDFDESGSYPVWFLTYGGPHAPTVNDSFRGGRTWEQMLAHAGIVVFRADPYAASGKGVASAWTTHRRMGVGEQADIEASIDWILEKPWADASRVGMSGHSFGGYITAYSMVRSKRFAAGIAGAPVTSWRDYDSIYTERYMDVPQENPDGYRETSVVEHASDLHGELLLLHGTMDDNVHMQHTTRLISALQRANKAYGVLYYPGSRHGIWGAHVEEARWAFIRRTMGLGDEESDEASAD